MKFHYHVTVKKHYSPPSVPRIPQNIKHKTHFKITEAKPWENIASNNYKRKNKNGYKLLTEHSFSWSDSREMNAKK